VNNLPKVVTQQRRSRASNPRLLDRKSDALPLSHRSYVLPEFGKTFKLSHAQNAGNETIAVQHYSSLLSFL